MEKYTEVQQVLNYIQPVFYFCAKKYGTVYGIAVLLNACIIPRSNSPGGKI